MNRLRAIAVLPTLFTLANLFCGFFAIVVAARVDAPTSVEAPVTVRVGERRPDKFIRGLDPTDAAHNVMLSGWLIFLGMVFDALDGHVARLSRWTSDFGTQLDSLSDLVTFGVAPAFLLVKMCPSFTFLHREAVWIIAASFAACAALRLARFAAETDENDDHFQFSGLPSPAAAASLASFGIMFYALRQEDAALSYARQIDTSLQTALPIFAVVVALLMVSRIPYPHVVNQLFRGQRSFGHLVGLVFAILAVALIRGFALPLVCCSFVLMGPIKYAWQELVQRRPHQEPMF